MSAIFPGRYTAQIEGPFVVFLIRMRVNGLWCSTGARSSSWSSSRARRR
jgi:hypothetical protein